MLLTRRETNILKGIGILSVILSHTSIMCREMAVSPPLLGNETVCMAICEAGMSLFLFISGYGLHLSYKARGLEGYIRGKLIRVLIPYMIIQFICMAVAFFTTGLQGSLLFNLSQLVGINPTNLYDPTMWYISYALFWYVVFWIAYRIGKGSYISVVIIGIISAAGFFYVPRYWGNNADYCVMTFFLGLLTGFVEEKRKEPDKSGAKKSPYVLPVICAVLAVCGYTLMIHFHRLNIFTENLGAFMGMAAFWLLARILRDRYDFPVLYRVGTISYMLYLLEWKLIIRNKVYDVWGLSFITYAACFALTVILAVVLTKIFSRMRAYR